LHMFLLGLLALVVQKWHSDVHRDRLLRHQ